MNITQLNISEDYIPGTKAGDRLYWRGLPVEVTRAMPPGYVGILGPPGTDGRPQMILIDLRTEDERRADGEDV